MNTATIILAAVLVYATVATAVSLADSRASRHLRERLAKLSAERQALDAEWQALANELAAALRHRAEQAWSGENRSDYTDWGAQISDAINADPAEVARLREARRQAYDGEREPW